LPLAPHFLAITFDFTSFFTMAFLGGSTLFSAGLFWIRISYVNKFGMQIMGKFNAETFQYTTDKSFYWLHTLHLHLHLTPHN